MPAQDSGARDRHNNVIVGHRLANGHMSVHPPGQPCDLCASARASSHTPGRHRRPQARRGRVRRAIQSLVAGAAIATTMAALSVAADGGSASAATLHTAQPAATTITGVT